MEANPAIRSSSTAHGIAPAPATTNGPPAPEGDENNKSLHHKGRSKIPWSKDVWDRIDKAVETEARRTRIGARFLPIRMVPPKTTSVPADSYHSETPPGGSGPVFTVDEGATLRLNEYYVEFSLTPQQVDQEEGDFKNLGHSTAVTLATKAANTLAMAQDLVIFQGQNAVLTAAPFRNGTVLIQGQLSDTGLLNFPIVVQQPAGGFPPPAPPTQNGPPPPLLPAVSVIPVNPTAPNATAGFIWGSATFEAVSQAYAQLQAAGHYGPYALVLQTIPYADTYAPLPGGLVVTADRIKPLVTAGFFGTGTLPPNPAAGVVNVSPLPSYGVLVSLGGNTMDLVVGLEPVAAFMQEDVNGDFRFRVVERSALRVKDTTAIVVLQFNRPLPPG
jgi:uncharacterized linocin/CFP29 family protein